MGKLIKKKRGLSRRTFLRHAGVGAVTAPLIAACGNSAGPAAQGISVPGLETVFQHGIATGDPLSDRVIFWTRITAPGVDNISVVLRIYLDPALTMLMSQTNVLATSARDFTVKIDQAGLAAGTTYYYRFEALGFQSAVGRTRTAPSGGVSRLRFGVVSCSSYAHGFFNAYRFLRERTDLDAILHLGDYIYEYGTGEYGMTRPYEPNHEMVSLSDYRTRHAYYKQEPDLMELHRQFPFITTWDDHESTDNSWRDGANNHTEGSEGQWPQRKGFAQRAYDEWMPIRYPEAGNVNRIWRNFNYGNLADIYYLDTRLFDRDEPLGIPVPPGNAATDPARKMIGPVQRQWLLDNLSNSTATWKLIGNQVVFMQWNAQPGLKANGGPRGLNGDSWDGYMHERQLIVDHIRNNNINNVVILTGDVHSTWVGDITDDPNNPLAYNPATGDGSVAAEFVVTSVTSPGAIPLPNGADDAYRSINPHIKNIDLSQKGYSVLDVTPARVLCEYWYISTIDTRGGTQTFASAYPVAAGTNRIGAVVNTPTTMVSPSPAPAP